MSTLTIVILVIGGILLAIMILFFVLLVLYPIGGRRYNPARAKDVAELRKIAQTGLILIAALEKCRLKHGRYPRGLHHLNLENIDPELNIRLPIIPNDKSYDDFFPYSSVFIGNQRWDYSAERNLKSFRLSVKLGWEHGMSYSSQEKRWCYFEDIIRDISLDI